MIKAAVLLSGCGHRDGSEIREAVITLLELDKHDVQTQCFSYDANQYDVINHVDGSRSSIESRNILVESSRISRGKILNFSDLDVNDFDMLLIPGGYGVICNFSNIFQNKPRVVILNDLKRIIVEFHTKKKSIGAICIAPALVVASLSEYAKIEVTIGEDEENIIKNLGGVHINCETHKSVKDVKNNVFSCSAYMRNARLYDVYLGIQDMVSSMVKLNSRD